MTTPQRLLMTTDTVGGVWTYSLELARGLQQYGYEVILAAMGGVPSNTQQEEASALPNVRLFARPYRLEWMEDPWDDVDRAGDWLLSLAKEMGVECVHLNGYAHADLPWEVPALIVAHSCICSWWQAVHGGDAPTQYDRYRERVQAGLSAATTVVAPTQAMLQMLDSQWQIDPAKARVIWNGRSPTQPHAHKRVASVLSAGRVWDRAKNIQLLEQIAPRLHGEVLVAGDAHAPSGAAHPHTGVTLLGVLSQSELSERLARSMVYASPALYEPFGLSVLEAAKSGCALALSDLPTFRELWSDAAVFVPTDAPARWVQTLNMLLSNHSLCAELGKKAQKRAQRYTTEKMAEEYRQTYALARIQSSQATTGITAHTF